MAKPIKPLSNNEYRKEYPAHNRIQIGVTAIYLCDVHLNEIKDMLNQEEEDDEK